MSRRVADGPIEVPKMTGTCQHCGRIVGVVGSFTATHRDGDGVGIVSWECPGSGMVPRDPYPATATNHTDDGDKVTGND